MSRVRSFRRLLPWSIAFALTRLTMGCASGGDADNDTGQNDSGVPSEVSVTPTDGPAGTDAPHLGGDGSADARQDSDSATQDGAGDGTKSDSGGDTSTDSPADTAPDATDAADTGAKDTSPADTSPTDSPADTGTKDTGTPDTGGCVPVTLNDGDNDGGACPAPVTGSCGMGDIAGFSPTWIPPSGYEQGLCTSAQMDSIYNGCLASGATETTCNTAATAAPDCYGCIFTMEGTSPAGPIIETNNGVLEVNQAGCIALLEPCNLTCAEEVAASVQCEDTACETNCPVTDTTSLDNFETCEETAATCDPNGCDTYATEAACSNAITGASHPASVCLSGAMFEDLYNAVVPVFCGSP
jgi:hypothetical protein